MSLSRDALSVLAALTFATGCAGLPKTRYEGKQYLVFVEPETLMLEGNDVVALWKTRTIQKGNPQFQTTWQDGAYWFQSAENLEAFKADPAHYAPQYGGHCAYAVALGHLSPAYISTWEIIDGKLYVQHNEKAKAAWDEEQQKNLADARKNWPGIVADYGKSGPTLQ